MNRLDNYPEYYALSEDRYSCRNYSPAAVGRDMIMAVIDAARMAPSACNRQPWMFLIAETPELLEAVRASYERPWIETAPVAMVVCGLHDEAWHRRHDGKDHTDIDVAIAVEHACLAATSLGLATCWVCNFDPAVIREAFALPDNVEPIAILPIGYPADCDTATPKKRKRLDEIIRWGKF